MGSRIQVNEALVKELCASFRAIGASMASGLVKASMIIGAETRLMRLRRLPDPWLQVWALHVSESTCMTVDQAIDLAWHLYWRETAKSQLGGL